MKSNRPGSAGVSPAFVRNHNAAETAALPGALPGWHSRGYIPHLDALGLTQMVTFRLADSLPAKIIEEILKDPSVKNDAHRRERAEAYLDAGHGACHLRIPAVARMVESALLHFDGERYRMLEWSIMPNHVHVLVELLPGHTLTKVLHTWKSYTAHTANRMLGRSGAFWQIEYWDRFIRNEAHLLNAVSYINEKNRSPFSSWERWERWERSRPGCICKRDACAPRKENSNEET